MPRRGPQFKPDASDKNPIAEFYDSLQKGVFSGNPPELQWIGPSMWLHFKHDELPFTFTRANGDVIIPDTFSTDGGSIPPIISGIPVLEPWYYGAAYLIHDYYWVLRRARKPVPSLREVNIIMCEAIKTLQEDGYLTHNNFKGGPGTLYTIWSGVNSAPMHAIWNKYSLENEDA